jgi:hypothetical protein
LDCNWGKKPGEADVMDEAGAAYIAAPFGAPKPDSRFAREDSGDDDPD